MPIAKPLQSSRKSGPLRAILFDMDGLLLDSEPLYLDAAVNLFKELDVPLQDSSVRSIIGLSASEGISRLREAGRVKTPVEELVRRYHELYDELVQEKGVPKFTGVDRILQVVSGMGLPLAVVTSTDTTRAERMLDVSCLRSYFQVITAGDEVVQSKPNPEIYLLACDRLEVDPKTAVAFEDSPHGVTAASAAGCFVVAVPNRLTKGGEFACANKVVRRLDAPVLLRMLTNWRSQDAEGRRPRNTNDASVERNRAN